MLYSVTLNSVHTLFNGKTKLVPMTLNFDDPYCFDSFIDSRKDKSRNNFSF